MIFHQLWSEISYVTAHVQTVRAEPYFKGCGGISLDTSGVLPGKKPLPSKQISVSMMTQPFVQTFEEFPSQWKMHLNTSVWERQTGWIKTSSWNIGLFIKFRQSGLQNERIWEDGGGFVYIYESAKKFHTDPPKVSPSFCKNLRSFTRMFFTTL